MLHANFARSGAIKTPHETRRPVVLLVDDEREIGTALADQLRKRFEIVIATSGAEGLAVMHDREVAVVISDQRMPNMTGSEMLKVAQAENPDIVRILLTGYSDLAAVVQGVNEAKIFFYLTKPWRPAELQRVVESAADHNRLLRENRDLLRELKLANTDLEQRVAERTEELADRNRDLEAANHRIDELARTDALTGIPNRRHFEEMLDLEIVRSLREGAPLALLFLDLDHFKQVNDTFGHEAGDAVLVAAARSLRSRLRPYDMFARWGGEEFVVLLPGASRDIACEVAERLRAGLESLVVPPCERSVTGSFGAAVHLAGELAGDLVRRADEAAYRAKQGGRNRVEADAQQVPA